jgi:mono/diheme cytochrome c family protein
MTNEINRPIMPERWRAISKKCVPDVTARERPRAFHVMSLVKYSSAIMKGTFIVAMALSLTLDARALAAEGNATRGQRVFGACAACHSLQPDQNMTGPSSVGPKSGKRGEFQPIFVRP